jgi:hypothetical protein
MLMTGRTAIAAAGQNNNFFAGTQIEFLPGDGIIEIGLYGGDIAGITTGDLEVDIICGNMSIGLNILPQANGAAGRIPLYPDDYLLSGTCLGADRLIGKVRNLDAANAAVLYWAVKFDEF